MSDEDDGIARTLIVNYEDEAMRKRAEYQVRDIFGEFFSPYNGMIRKFEGDEETFKEAYEAIAKKVGEDNIRVERAEEVEMNRFSSSSILNYDIAVNKEAVDGFLNYWFETQIPKSDEIEENTYEFNHKKLGLGSASYDTEETESGTFVEVQWSANTEESVEAFAELFEEDLEGFEESQ